MTFLLCFQEMAIVDFFVQAFKFFKMERSSRQMVDASGSHRPEVVPTKLALQKQGSLAF